MAAARAIRTRPTCKFLLVLTAEERVISYPRPGLAVGGLSLCMLSLGAGGLDEEHLLEAEGAKVQGRTESQTTASLSIRPCQPTLGLGIKLTPPVTFRLKTGPGPLFISGQYVAAEENTSAAVATVTAKWVSGSTASQGHQGAKHSSVELQILESMNKWKRLNEMQGIGTPGVQKATQSAKAKKRCQGLSVPSPVTSIAKELCQGTSVCQAAVSDTPSTVENGIHDAGGKHLTQGATVSKPVEPTLQKKQQSQKIKVLEGEVPLTTDEIKAQVQQKLIYGAKIPIQIFKFRDYLQNTFKYADGDYNRLVLLWRWRLSLYKAYG